MRNRWTKPQMEPSPSRLLLWDFDSEFFAKKYLEAIDRPGSHVGADADKGRSEHAVNAVVLAEKICDDSNKSTDDDIPDKFRERESDRTIFYFSDIVCNTSPKRNGDDP